MEPVDTTDFPPITEVENEAFGRLVNAVNARYDNHQPALMRARLDGVTDVAVVVSVEDLGEQTAVYPLAILLDTEDPSLYERLVPAGDEDRIRE